MGPKLPSSCVGAIICSILDHFTSNASLFTGFWLGWVGKALFFTRQMPSHNGRPRTAVELRWSYYNICCILDYFKSKVSPFTGFWLGWVGKARFFTRQMPSHSGRPQTAVELRWSHYLRHFGSLQLQSLAIYKLLARLGGKSFVFYAPDALS